MKKLVFGLIATVALTSISFAQSNSKNPHDSFGKLHNEVVAVYQAQYAGKGLSMAETCAQTEKIVNQNAAIVALNGGKYVKVNTELIVESSGDFKNQFVNVINNSKLSGEGKLRAQELLNYMFTIAFTEQYTTYDAFYSHIVEFENSILSNSKLTAADKTSILCGTSTARYSIHFWNKQYGGANQPNTVAKRGFWGSLIVGICDVGGAVVGYLEGGVATGLSTATGASNAAGEVVDSK